MSQLTAEETIAIQVDLVMLATGALNIERLDAYVEQTTDADARALAIATAVYQRAVARIFGTSAQVG